MGATGQVPWQPVMLHMLVSSGPQRGTCHILCAPHFPAPPFHWLYMCWGPLRTAALPPAQHQVPGERFGEQQCPGSRGRWDIRLSCNVFVDLCTRLLDYPKLCQEINVTTIFERQIYIIYFLNTELKKL